MDVDLRRDIYIRMTKETRYGEDIFRVSVKKSPAGMAEFMRRELWNLGMSFLESLEESTIF